MAKKPATKAKTKPAAKQSSASGRVPWTEKDVALMKKLAGKKPAREIAAALKPPRSEGAVRQKMFSLELSASTRG